MVVEPSSWYPFPMVRKPTPKPDDPAQYRRFLDIPGQIEIENEKACSTRR